MTCTKQGSNQRSGDTVAPAALPPKVPAPPPTTAAARVCVFGRWSRRRLFSIAMARPVLLGSAPDRTSQLLRIRLVMSAARVCKPPLRKHRAGRRLHCTHSTTPAGQTGHRSREPTPLWSSARPSSLSASHRFLDQACDTPSGWRAKRATSRTTGTESHLWSTAPPRNAAKAMSPSPSRVALATSGRQARLSAARRYASISLRRPL